MGKMALWGAIEGLGKGLSRGAEMRYEEEKATTADRRGMRLEHFKQMQMNERTKLTEGGATERHKESVSAQRDISTATNALRETMAKSLQAHQTGFQERKYVLEGELEKLKQEGRFDLAQVDAISSTSQWEFSEYEIETVDPESGARSVVEIKTASDKVSGVTFDQHGSHMVPTRMPFEAVQERFPGTQRGADGEYLLTEKERKKAKEDAEAWLIAKPEMRGRYLESFGYLPTSFFEKHGGLVPTRISRSTRETTKVPRAEEVAKGAETTVTPEVPEAAGEAPPTAPPEIVAALDKAGFGGGPAAPGALERAAAAEVAPPVTPGVAPPATPVTAPQPGRGPGERGEAPVAPPGQPVAPAPPAPPPPITVGIQRGRTGEPGTLGSFIEAAGEQGRESQAAFARDIAATRGSSERLRADIVEGIRKPQKAIAIAENAVKTGNIQSQSDFDALKRDWMMVRPYVSQEVILALEPLLLKGPSPTPPGAPPPPPAVAGR